MPEDAPPVPRGRSLHAVGLAAMGTRTAAHVVGSTLASLGVDTVFGLAGSGNFAVTNALVEGGARFHSSRHEGGAVAMAATSPSVRPRVGAPRTLMRPSSRVRS